MNDQRDRFNVASHSTARFWLALVGIVLVAAILVWFAPAERTLGRGIKAVYIHVTLIWAGMLGFLVAGILGLVLAFVPKSSLLSWKRNISWVAFIWFAVGFLMSLLAARINWGAVYWDEPRLISSFQFLVVALFIQIGNRYLRGHRFRGLLTAFLAFFMMWWILGTPQVLHPGSPIRESNSLAIQLTFLGLFVLNCTAATLVVLSFRGHAERIK